MDQVSQLDSLELVKSKISEIEQTQRKNPLKAMWRLSLLFSDDMESNELVENSFNSFFQKFTESLELAKKDNRNLDYFAAYESGLEILDSTKNYRKNELSLLDFQDKYLEIEKSIKGDLAKYLKKASNQKMEKFSTLIDGTATIWVDLGVKIESGLAYSNKAIGSGFFIDERGYLITNYHVIYSEVDTKYRGISNLYIKTGDDQDSKIPAKVVGFDKSLDLALLKVEVPVDYVFALGSSKDLDIGDSIYAIGSPVGLERTLTKGIISAEGRQLFSIGTVLQIDAAINQGNSGGPIIDNFGNVQGIAFAGMLDFEGLNFAIPIEYLRVLLPKLYQGSEIKHSYLGVYGKTLKGQGVEVIWLESRGNAETAGLLPGDIIYEINGKKINSLEELHWNMIDVSPNSLIELSVKDEKGLERKIKIFTDERLEYPGLSIYKNESISEAFLPLYGLKLKRASSLYKSKFTVESVVKGSIASEAGFTENDPIQIIKATVKEGKYLFVEVYSKKKSNGYLDVSLVMPAALDSENLF
ncbi:MAG: trypsin-like peptidase domain-containing protein [Treponemataceae bacterium]|nr:trypsin-like peptidase domain-containing protein [Treponemataceae bacterium]